MATGYFRRDSSLDYFVTLRDLTPGNGFGKIWYPAISTFSIYGTGGKDKSDYGIECLHTNSDGFFTFTTPSAANGKKLLVEIYIQDGDDPADTDTFNGSSEAFVTSGGEFIWGAGLDSSGRVKAANQNSVYG